MAFGRGLPKHAPESATGAQVPGLQQETVEFIRVHLPGFDHFHRLRDVSTEFGTAIHPKEVLRFDDQSWDAENRPSFRIFQSG